MVNFADRHSAMVESATMARMYYVEGKSKSEIAQAFSYNRFKVARILEDALEQGFVAININYPNTLIDVDLSSRLSQHLTLKHCVVVTTSDDTPLDLLRDLGEASGSLLAEVTAGDDVIGIAWTRAMESMINTIRELPAKAIVQLCGAYPGHGTEPTALDLVREIGRKSVGQAFTYYAPMLATDAAAGAAIRRQVEYQAASEMFSHVTTAVVGVGAWAKGLSTVADGIDSQSFEDARKAGVVADICGRITLAENGDFVPSGVGERCVSVDATTLAGIPNVIGVVFGRERALAARAAVRGGYVNSLVTHASLAQELLAAEP